MFTNGSTAIECGGGLNAAAAAGAGAASGVACFETQNLLATMYARAANATTATIASRSGLAHWDARIGFLTAAMALDMVLAGSRVAAGASGDSSRRTRSTNAGGVSPAGRRVHCARLNDSGTSEAASVVASRHTGTTNTRLRAIMWER